MAQVPALSMPSIFWSVTAFAGNSSAWRTSSQAHSTAEILLQGIPQSPPALPPQPSGLTLSPRGSSALQQHNPEISPFMVRQQQQQQLHQHHSQAHHHQHQQPAQHGSYLRHPSEPPPGHLFARPPAQELTSPSPPPATTAQHQDPAAQSRLYAPLQQQPEQRAAAHHSHLVPPAAQLQQHLQGSRQQPGSTGHSPQTHVTGVMAMEEDELGDDVGLIDAEVFEMLLNSDDH